MPKKKFSKPALSINQQIDFLSQQGMKIEDADLAASVLSVVSYYRLSAYLLPFKLPHQNNTPRRFKSNTTFDQIWQLYQFDRELRLLVSDAIEKIEVAFRTVLVNVTCLEFEPFWYVESSHFKNPRQHANLLKNIDEIISNKKELCIKHYYDEYHDPNYPPIWMIVETLSFGVCSKLFSNIKKISLRNKIAEQLGQHTTILESWLQTLTYIRNICAHHSRLWNRWVVNPPLIPKYEIKREHYITRDYRFHLVAYVIQQLLEKISPKSHWKSKLFELFEKYEMYPGAEMGFSEHWREDAFWE